MPRWFRGCHGVPRYISVGEGKCVGKSVKTVLWMLLFPLSPVPFLMYHVHSLPQSHDFQRARLQLLPLPNEVSQQDSWGLASPHTFPCVCQSRMRFFFPQKCIACWMKLVSINLLGCSLSFIFRVPNTTSGILLCCIVFRSRLLVSLMSVYLGLGSPLILVLGRNEPTWWMRIKQVFSSQLVAQLLANIVLL